MKLLLNDVAILVIACVVSFAVGFAVGYCVLPPRGVSPTTTAMTRVPLPGGRSFDVPAGTPVTVRVTSIPGRPGSTTDTGTGTGIGLNSAGGTISDKLNFAPNTVDLGSLKGTSGGGSLTSRITGFSPSSGMVAWALVGGLLIVVGIVVCIWLKSFALGGSLIAAGLALIAVGVLVTDYPWVLAVAAGVMLIVGGIILYEEYGKGLFTTAATDAIKAIEAAGTITPDMLANVEQLGADAVTLTTAEYPQAQKIISAVETWIKTTVAGKGNTQTTQVVAKLTS
jgi:hypothetical protein